MVAKRMVCIMVAKREVMDMRKVGIWCRGGQFDSDEGNKRDVLKQGYSIPCFLLDGSNVWAKHCAIFSKSLEPVIIDLFDLKIVFW